MKICTTWYCVYVFTGRISKSITQAKNILTHKRTDKASIDNNWRTICYAPSIAPQSTVVPKPTVHQDKRGSHKPPFINNDTNTMLREGIKHYSDLNGGTSEK